MCTRGISCPIPCLSIHPCISVCLICLHPSVRPSIHPSPSFPRSLIFIHIFICLHLSVSIFILVHQTWSSPICTSSFSLHLSIYIYVYISIYPRSAISIHPYLSVHLISSVYMHSFLFIHPHPSMHESPFLSLCINLHPSIFINQYLLPSIHHHR